MHRTPPSRCITDLTSTPETARRPTFRRLHLPDVLRPAWTEIDLGALSANLRRLRETVAPARALAVIKADAYGHGAVEVAPALEAAGVDMLGVALLEEGAEVRRAGVAAPILVLGAPRPPQLPYYRRYRLTPVVSGMDQLAMWREHLAGPGGYVQPVHLQVDTGMTRLGVAEADFPEALRAIRDDPHLELAGVLSHFADADLLESERNPEQERRFRSLLEAVPGEHLAGAAVHMANSAAALHQPASRHDLVRLGLALYGYDPAGPDASAASGLLPVMSLKTRAVLLRDIAPGTRVSYGGRWTAERPSRIAVLPVGYADGYAWRLTGKAEGLVRGRRVPVVGAVSMDMIFVDLTDHPGREEIGVGEEVVLLGRQGDERITAFDLAETVGTIPYELLCLLGLRLARRYVGGPTGGEVRSRFEGGLP
jgi:alanine racemase